MSTTIDSIFRPELRAAMTPETIRLARDSGITAMASLLVLLALAQQSNPLPMAKAAGYAGVTAAAMTGTVEGLVELGLVDRRSSLDDRRKVLLGLTPKGEQLMSQCLLAVTRP
jgi:DNA-binding MarR family transcriptional regulator